MFNVGDLVQCKHFGRGFVIRVDSFGKYPIKVRFNGTDSTYTREGYMYIGLSKNQRSCITKIHYHRLRWRPNVTFDGRLMGYTTLVNEKLLSLCSNSGVISTAENGKIKPITIEQVRRMLDETQTSPS